MDYGILARSYNTLHYEPQLRALLSNFFKELSFDGLTKYALHQSVNETLLKHYQGEEILKFRLAKFFREKDYVAAFEVKAKGSRADFLVINGETKCFEIKSKIDNLKRLGKQSNDYKDVFEFNTVVTDQKHLTLVEELLPKYYGIWTFEGNERIEYRKCKRSPSLDSMSQLSLMTKKELVSNFGLNDHEIILSNYSKDAINEILKECLKKRYQSRWNFVQANWDSILPIDIQFFFNCNIRPEVVYR